MSEYKKQIILGSALAIIIALGLGVGIVYLPQHFTQPMSSVVFSTTAPCNAPGVQCGRVVILFASLVAPAVLNSTSYSTLNITVSNTSTGGLQITSIRVSLNNTAVGTIPGPIEVGKSTTAVLQIPSSIIQVTASSHFILVVQSNEAGNQTSITAH